MEEALTINCDGGARGNPGPAAASFVVHKDGKEVFSQAKFLGETTNNTAEYQAVVLALNWLKENSGKFSKFKVNFVLDSELVVRQLNGVYKIKNEKLRGLAVKIKELQKNLPFKISFSNVAREKNKKADFLVNKVLDENT